MDHNEDHASLSLYPFLHTATYCLPKNLLVDPWKFIERLTAADAMAIDWKNIYVRYPYRLLYRLYAHLFTVYDMRFTYAATRARCHVPFFLSPLHFFLFYLVAAEYWIDFQRVNVYMYSRVALKCEEVLHWYARSLKQLRAMIFFFYLFFENVVVKNHSDAVVYECTRRQLKVFIFIIFLNSDSLKAHWSLDVWIDVKKRPICGKAALFQFYYKINNEINVSVWRKKGRKYMLWR